jgi:hypothetical protein
MVIQNTSSGTVSAFDHSIPPGSSLVVMDVLNIGSVWDPSGNGLRFFFGITTTETSGVTQGPRTLHGSLITPVNESQTMFGTASGSTLTVPGHRQVTLSPGAHILSLSLGERMVLASSLDGTVMDEAYGLEVGPEVAEGGPYDPGALLIPGAVQVKTLSALSAQVATELSLTDALTTQTFISDEDVARLQAATSKSYEGESRLVTINVQDTDGDVLYSTDTSVTPGG